MSVRFLIDVCLLILPNIAEAYADDRSGRHQNTIRSKLRLRDAGRATPNKLDPDHRIGFAEHSFLPNSLEPPRVGEDAREENDG